MVPLVGGGAVERKVNESGRGYVQAQEYGLPARITGLARGIPAGVFGARVLNDIQRKEVVIENDIAWRVNAAADFLFGKPISLISRAAEGRKREEIEAILKALFAANGGPGFFQDMAVLGSVYGFVDCFLRPGDPLTTRSSSSSHPSSLPLSSVLQWAQAIDLELIEAPRALPVLDEDDYRVIRYYVQHFQQRKNAVGHQGSFLSRLVGGIGYQAGPPSGRCRDGDHLARALAAL